jgi:hypothetical protein
LAVTPKISEDLWLRPAMDSTPAGYGAERISNVECQDGRNLGGDT